MNNMSDIKTALHHVRRDLALLDGEYLSTEQKLGKALAQVRTGESNAQTVATKASKRLQEIGVDRDRLRLEESALIGQLTELEAQESEREGAQALRTFQEIDDELNEFHRQFTELIRAAAVVGQKIRSMKEPYEAAAERARTAGHHLDLDQWKTPANLLRGHILDDPDREIESWLGPSVWREIQELRKLPDSPPIFHIGTEPPNGQDVVIRTIPISSEDAGFMGHSLGLKSALGSLLQGGDGGSRIPGTRSSSKRTPSSQKTGGLEKRSNVA